MGFTFQSPAERMFGTPRDIHIYVHEYAGWQYRKDIFFFCLLSPVSDRIQPAKENASLSLSLCTCLAQETKASSLRCE